MRLTSTHNPVVKYVRSLEQAAVRRESGTYLVEGVRLVREARATGQTAVLTLFDRKVLERSAAGAGLLADVSSWACESYDVDARVLKAAAQTEHPSGALAVLKFPDVPPLGSHRRASFGVILDTISDPGNAGTIARTAVAAGAAYLVSTVNSVDLFAPKVVRAGMGAHFRLPIYGGVPWDQLQESLGGTTLVAAAADAGEVYYDFRWPESSALVVGSEAHGLSAEASSRVHAHVRIPMQPGVESLNASVAAGILMYAACVSTSAGGPSRYK